MLGCLRPRAEPSDRPATLSAQQIKALVASECSRSGSSVITGRECHGPFAAACNDLSHEFAGSVRGHCESLAVSGTLADGLTRICSAVSSSR